MAATFDATLWITIFFGFDKKEGKYHGHYP